MQQELQDLIEYIPLQQGLRHAAPYAPVFAFQAH